MLSFTEHARADDCQWLFCWKYLQGLRYIVLEVAGDHVKQILSSTSKFKNSKPIYEISRILNVVLKIVGLVCRGAFPCDQELEQQQRRRYPTFELRCDYSVA